MKDKCNLYFFALIPKAYFTFKAQIKITHKRNEADL